MGRNILLVFYRSEARSRLETTLLAQQLEVYAIDGWASSAVAELKENRRRWWYWTMGIKT